MARSAVDPRPCSRPEALARLDQAEQFLAVARLVVDEQEYPVAAALAVLAGIAASDAACCARLGKRHRGPDHRGAEELVATVEPGGPEMAKDLKRLLQRKDDTHYAPRSVSRNDAQKLVDWARRLTRLATTAVEA